MLRRAPRAFISLHVGAWAIKGEGQFRKAPGVDFDTSVHLRPAVSALRAD